MEYDAHLIHSQKAKLQTTSEIFRRGCLIFLHERGSKSPKQELFGKDFLESPGVAPVSA